MSQVSAVAVAPVAKVEGGLIWDDTLRLDDSLDDDERLIRDAARDYCQSELLPRVLTAHREEHFDREIMREMGQWGLLWCDDSPRVRRRGGKLRFLRAGGPRSRAGGFRLPLGHERPVESGDVSDLCRWQ